MKRKTKGKITKTALLALLIALAGATLVQARMRGDFDVADANHDGRVTFQEYQTYVTTRLMAAKAPMAQRFRQLTPQEQTERLQRRFDKEDRGHKGFLDRNDWNGQ